MGLFFPALRGVILAAALLFSTAAFAEQVDGRVEIARANGESVFFWIELADDPQERSRGLMFREDLPDDHGMLFVYPANQIASFWMKNTLISLDMLFIRSDGMIVQIARGAVPHSLQPIRSQEPVRAVLELEAGVADSKGIAVGDIIRLYLSQSPPQAQAAE